MKESKAHGNTGRRNAAKPEGEKQDSRLVMRCREEDKAAWKQAADKEGISMAAWIIKTLNNEAKKD